MGDRHIVQQLDENVSKYCIISNDSVEFSCTQQPEHTLPPLPELPSFYEIPTTDVVTTRATTLLTTLLTNLSQEVPEGSTSTDPTISTPSISTSTRSSPTSSGAAVSASTKVVSPSGNVTDSLTFSTSATNINTPDITTGQSIDYDGPPGAKVGVYCTIAAFLVAFVVVCLVLCYIWYKKKRSSSEGNSSSLQFQQDLAETDMNDVNLKVSPKPIESPNSTSQVRIEHDRINGNVEMTPVVQTSEGEVVNGKRSPKNGDLMKADNEDKGGKNTGENSKENDKGHAAEGEKPPASTNDPSVSA